MELCKCPRAKTCYRGQIAAEMKLASKCVGRSKRLTQPKLNLEKQPDTSLSLTHTGTHTPAQWAISAVGVVSVSVSTWTSFYLCRVVVIFVVVVVVVAIAVLRLLLLMAFRDPTTPNTSGGPAKIDRHNAI